jgi:glycosyltransferase involved in cell wall biosynthesis
VDRRAAGTAVAWTLRRSAFRPVSDVRIAMVAPPWYEVPPSSYGGIEAMVADLVGQLSVRGHEITLIGAGRDLSAASRFIPVFDAPPTSRLGEALPEVEYAAAVGQILAGVQVDLVHDHSLAGPLLARGRPVPTVVTMHGPVSAVHGEIMARLGDSVHVVAISDAQRVDRPELNWAGTVHNALDIDAFPYAEDKDDFVLWMGRFTPDKGPVIAIDAARAAGLPIVLAGKRSEPAEQEYFDAEIVPRLGDDATYVGEVDGDAKRELFARARVLVFPIQWEEPFGIVMLEAMACGTPVVATRRGSVAEIVQDGETGIVLDADAGVEEIGRALHAAVDIDPRRCRDSVRERFAPGIMADGYEEVYRSVVGR